MRTTENLNELHQKITALLEQDRSCNPVTYYKSTPYQSYDRIQFKGLRWSPEKRIKDYGIDQHVFPGSTVLDIGCNSGFLAIELAYAYQAGMVCGIEPNPWLIEVAETVADYLNVGDRTKFINCRFDEMSRELDFDVILSLAAFYTGDAREREEADAYFRRCWSLLTKGGCIIYESTSFSETESPTHLHAAKRAVEAMSKLFTTMAHVIKPSGSPGWKREYFIGKKK